MTRFRSVRGDVISRCEPICMYTHDTLPPSLNVWCLSVTTTFRKAPRTFILGWWSCGGVTRCESEPGRTFIDAISEYFSLSCQCSATVRGGEMESPLDNKIVPTPQRVVLQVAPPCKACCRRKFSQYSISRNPDYVGRDLLLDEACSMRHRSNHSSLLVVLRTLCTRASLMRITDAAG